MTDTYTTGLEGVDVLTGGLHAGTVTVVLGTSQSGMSTLLDTCVRANAFTHHTPAMICDRETPAQDRVKRIMSGLSGVNLATIQRGKFTDVQRDRLRRAADATQAAPLLFSNDHTVDRLRWSIIGTPPRTRVVAVDGMRFLDFSDTVTPDHDRNVLSELCEMARDLNVAVVATHPLSVHASGRVPTIADVPDGFASLADTVLLLNRPGLAATGRRWESTHSDLVEVICVKARLGQFGTTSLVADFERAQFISAAMAA
ncbi:DnaB-like helicase C-terminal domain-containing protein [Micromonospora tulbaghiae]|uniref:DnaB-like helicase C-terminal domain-containing protein n=1 Tax=Micromonospora tulbaghiae TaxID=479978 RepID=UPI0033EFCEEA